MKRLQNKLPLKNSDKKKQEIYNYEVGDAIQIIKLTHFKHFMDMSILNFTQL